MKLEGYRLDGTLRVGIPGGVTVILRDDLASPPLDDQEADRLGPWLEPPVGLSWQERLELQQRLDRSRVVPAQAFALQFPFQKKKADAPAAAPADAEVPAAPAADEAPAKAEIPTDEKGALLEQIKKIAAARAKEKDSESAPEKDMSALPRFGKKRLTLEYETEDHEGESDDKKKPVSEVALPATDTGE